MLTGFISVWLINIPDPEPAPEIFPVMVPIVHWKLLVTAEARTIPVLSPLQIAFVEAVLTTGNGLTVTVIVKGCPLQEPVVEAGVTIYCTVPAVELDGSISI